MSYKTERLLQRINQLQDYLSGNAHSHPIIKGISKEAIELANSLNEGKLAINIIRTAGEGAATLERHLSDRPEVKNDFSVRVMELPDAEDETPPALILQDPEASPMRQTYYDLAPESALIAGRDPKRASLLIADSFSRVSGRHA